MKHKFQSIILILVIIPVFIGQSGLSSREWTPGVSSGDFFTYKMFGVYTSNRSNATIAIPQFEKNNTDWTRISISNVHGSVINQIYTLHQIDGSQTSFFFKTDVNPDNQGDFKISDKGIPICASNLGSGDRIPTAELILNNTSFKVYQSGVRQTNHAFWNLSDDWGDVYFDKSTGVLVELNRTHVFANAVTGMVVEKTDVIHLIDTNRWKISNQPLT